MDDPYNPELNYLNKKRSQGVEFDTFDDFYKSYHSECKDYFVSDGDETELNRIRELIRNNALETYNEFKGQ